MRGYTQGYRVYDKGHHYKLGSLDGVYDQHLIFVKRYDPEDPSKYPGNRPLGLNPAIQYKGYPGTTLQFVLRVLINRVKYLQSQKWCVENICVLFTLRLSIWFLEFRAARRHRRFYFRTPSQAAEHLACSVCGHTGCTSQHYGEE